MLKVGDKIEIISMEGEPQYSGKTGVVTHTNVDPWGETQVWGTWGGCCLYEGKDTYKLLEKGQ
jgi:hypothetical protein